MIGADNFVSVGNIGFRTQKPISSGNPRPTAPEAGIPYQGFPASAFSRQAPVPYSSPALSDRLLPEFRTTASDVLVSVVLVGYAGGLLLWDWNVR